MLDNFMCNSNLVEEKYVIGIDGGGTKTEFVLCSESGRILSRLKLSRSNPNDIGLEKSCEVLAEGIDRLLKDSPPVCGIFAGIAGCLTGDNAKKVKGFLADRYPLIDVNVDTDGVNVLSCNSDFADSMALICGTGSVLLAREKGRLHRIGGWGYLFDEAGSAYDIGKDAIKAVLGQLDGLGEDTMLTDLLKKEMQDEIWETLTVIYQKGKAYIASLAPIVFRAHAMGDKVAEKILHKNAENLALLIATAMKRYNCGRSVVACGGLIENFRDVLVPMVTEILDEEVEFIFPKVPPVYGACVEGFRRGNIMPDRKFYERFCAEYIW